MEVHCVFSLSVSLSRSVCACVRESEYSASQYLSALPRPQTSHPAQQTVKLSNAT